MSQPFMYAIAAMYLCAGVAFAWDGKLEWCGISFCWGIGNFLIGYISAQT